MPTLENMKRVWGIISIPGYDREENTMQRYNDMVSLKKFDQTLIRAGSLAGQEIGGEISASQTYWTIPGHKYPNVKRGPCNSNADRSTKSFFFVSRERLEPQSDFYSCLFNCCKFSITFCLLKKVLLEQERENSLTELWIAVIPERGTNLSSFHSKVEKKVWL